MKQANSTPTKSVTPSSSGRNKGRKQTPKKSPRAPQQQKQQQKQQKQKQQQQKREVEKSRSAPSPKTANNKKRNKKQHDDSEKKLSKKRTLQEMKRDEEKEKEEQISDSDSDVMSSSSSDQENDDKLLDMLASRDSGDEEESSDEEEKEEEESAKKKTKRDEKSKENAAIGKFIVEVNNVQPSFEQQHIETALKDEGLPFVSVAKYTYNAARISVESEEHVQKYLAKRRLKLQKTTLLFSVNKQEDDQITIHNLSPEITKDILMPYMKDIAQENGVNVEQIEIYPTQQIQGRGAAYVKFSGPVPKATEFHRAKIQGKPIDIAFVNENDRKVLIRNVHKTITEDELLEYVQDAGEVEYLYIVTNEDGESAQRAIVCYKSISSARNILDYNGADIHGKPVRIDLVRDEDTARRSRHRDMRHRARR